MQLIIAEKPSVAREIARVLGANEHHDGYVEGHEYVVSWCIGHLVELCKPEGYDVRYAKWRYEDLPILPEKWSYSISSSTRKQFDTLERLMHDSRVNSVVCATDAGREGELIFRLVYEKAGCTLPVKRLWISSLEEKAILDGLKNMKDGSCYDTLYQAALCRERADWLVGINATRLFSLIYGQTLRIGRVATPTLAMVVNREEAIQTFKPESFYTVQLDTGFTTQSERFFSEMEAKRLRDACKKSAATVQSVHEIRKIEYPPKLYDLTTLQRDANRIFGYTAQQTMNHAQQLYEKKLITYPRTDSRFLPNDLVEMLPGHVKASADTLPSISSLVQTIHPEQVIDDSKITDHHAIIPTRSMPKQMEKMKELPTGERNILNLVIVRLACAVSEPCVYDESHITLTCADHAFTTKGKHIVSIGWKAIQHAFGGSIGEHMKDENGDMRVPQVIDGQTFNHVDASVKEGQTTPPSRYTEDTLLSAMECAGAKDMPEDTEHKGIGTPATRAGTLEKLVHEGLIQRSGSGKTKHFVPTSKGTALVAVVPQLFQSAAMTADWEQRLKQIEHGTADPQAFMEDIVRMLREMTRQTQRVPDAEVLFPSQREKLGSCPACGSAVSETPKGFFCENRTCHFGLWKDNRLLTGSGKKLTAEMVEALLHDGAIQMNGLISKKTGKPYNATLLMEWDEDGTARFRMAFN